MHPLPGFDLSWCAITETCDHPSNRVRSLVVRSAPAQAGIRGRADHHRGCGRHHPYVHLCPAAPAGLLQASRSQRHAHASEGRAGKRPGAFRPHWSALSTAAFAPICLATPHTRPCSPRRPEWHRSFSAILPVS